ncbi:MAG: PTS sugar transporter subunit IIA, partial [Desulfitobacteriaceae bacterium]|nr:PTS sugar transporter subunit IIA [Desulfitobacteriaceae bacterium]
MGSLKVVAKKNMDVCTSSEAITQLVRVLESEGCVKGSFLPAVLERESRFPTGLGLDGPINVALAHADPEHVVRSAFAVGQLKRPVKFRRMDDPDCEIDVHMVFVMAAEDASSVTTHLRNLIERIFQRRE